MTLKIPLLRPSTPIIFGIVAFVVLGFVLLPWSQHSLRLSASRLALVTSSAVAEKPPLLDDIFNATVGFQKIYVIALPARTDRRDGIVLSAALSNMVLEFVDGVTGDSVPDKAIPAWEGYQRLDNPVIGCWRGHMNAIQDMIRRNITSALILEDDADWDVRLKEQLRDFALSSHALTQPLSSDPSAYADRTFPTPKDALDKPASDIYFQHLPSTVPPTISPYGDNWDFLWIGHCGQRLPSADVPWGDQVPKGRVIHHPDPTVPQTQYLTTVASTEDLKNGFDNHTRIVHHVQEGVCSLGYGISQAGARKLMHAVGLQKVNTGYDTLLMQFCQGSEGRGYHNCLSVLPSLFHHHRPAGLTSSESDISPHGDEFKTLAHTDNVRWSTRMNWDVLLDGRTDFSDQFPDIE